ncbi:thioredoxin reductase (NADPH) [Desulfosalsimonas propionicica]|uniref:Thioredoxin reductase (NADPH) n=1 Tax=Desulfosalsimonas propionicica TaxID=332175 RepID=A0A7W0CCR9_9BACT|nr:FAD-dependent oxidoreductase [Desulfosalsimonas propionicica]MBA2883257.1 thioredoxin reductase (NADPH) [Desulfosalsimonas propionicica]
MTTTQCDTLGNSAYPYEENEYDLVIIGAGPAGMTASIYAIRANMRVLLLDKLSPGGQVINTLEVQNYPGAGIINGAELAIQMFEQTQALGVPFEYATATQILENNGKKQIVCEEGQTFQARAVIIATGTNPRRLGVPGEEKFAGDSIHWCAICDGSQYRCKTVAMIGGGNSAVEESLYLAGIADHLSLITLFDLTADPAACDKLRALPNVTIYECHEILEFIGTNGLEAIRARCTKSGEEITVRTEGAFEYIGLEPKAEAFKNLGILNEHGYIEADSWMETRAGGIFGAGDINSKNLRQIVTACSDGALAAQAAARYIEMMK